MYDILKRWQIRDTGLSVVFFSLLLQAVGSLAADEEVSRTTNVVGRIVAQEGPDIPATRLNVWALRHEPERHWETIASPQVQADGAFELREVDVPFSLLFQAEATGFATGWSMLHSSEAETKETRIVLSPPARMTLRVSDSSDRPIAGARLRWMKIEGPNGRVPLASDTFNDLGLSRPISDSNGLLHVSDLPLSSTLTAGVMHPGYAPAEVKGVTVSDEAEPVPAEMQDGVPLRIQIVSSELDEPVTHVTIELRHEPFSHPSTIMQEQLSLDEAGQAHVTVEAGQYRALRFTHPDAVIGPAYHCDFQKERYLTIDDQTPRLTFHATPKIEVRGQAIHAHTGKAISDQVVSGENRNPPGYEGLSEFVAPWKHTDWGRTDSNGWFTMQLAPGPTRISFAGQGYTTRAAYCYFNVPADGAIEAPVLELIPIEPIEGRVLSPEQKPVQGAVVRLRGDRFRWTQPVATDEDGRFRLAVPFIPVNEDTDELLVRHPVVAYHPYQPFAGTTWVHLDQPEHVSDVVVPLQRTNHADLVTLIEGELTPHERGQLPEAERDELARISLVGERAPELDGAAWLNTPRSRMSLADYRGRYVLLDFWTTWCGPCRGDLPSLKLLQQLYGGKRFTIIGVHDNSVDAKEVADHVKEYDMDYPIVIDHPDGRILRKYEAHGVQGYPTYILVGPDGRVLIHNKVSAGPSLRIYKLELIRQLLDGFAAPSYGADSAVDN